MHPCIIFSFKDTHFSLCSASLDPELPTRLFQNRNESGRWVLRACYIDNEIQKGPCQCLSQRAYPGLSASRSTQSKRVSTQVEDSYFSKTVQRTGTEDDWCVIFYFFVVCVRVLSPFVYLFAFFLFFAFYNTLISINV